MIMIDVGPKYEGKPFLGVRCKSFRARGGGKTQQDGTDYS